MSDNMKWEILTLLAIVLIALTASASTVSSLEGSIYVGETPYELSFYVENNTNTKQPLNIETIFPTRTTIDAPDWVEANSQETVVLKVYPEEGFEGQKYSYAIVNIELGGTNVEKNVLIDYARENNCTVETNSEETETGLKVKLTNKGFKEKTVTIKEINNAPSTWTFEKEEFVVGAYEERTFDVLLNKNGSFSGDAEIVFSCSGKEIAEKVRFDYTEKDLLSGFVIFGDSEPNTTENEDYEIILDIFLVIIAAILLIAFIARLVRIMYTKQTEVKK